MRTPHVRLVEFRARHDDARARQRADWQKGGHEGYDLDIEETLGTQARELDGQVRRFDMDRLRDPRGQEYRRYGVRSGHMT